MAATQRSPESRKLVWGGLVVALLSFVLYFGFTLNRPGSAGFTWIHEVTAVGGAVLAAIGWYRGTGRWAVRAATAVSVLATVLLLSYVHLISARLPSSGSALAVGSVVPGFRLEATGGTQLVLENYRGAPLILVFYRGYW